MQRHVYLDYNATTPLDPMVRAAMLPYLETHFGNPSSIHRPGRFARSAVDDARDQVSSVWKCKPSEVVFTSGGTESNNLALVGAARLRRSKGKHLVASPTEHPSVLEPLRWLQREEGFELTLLPVDGTGRVDPADLRKILRKETTVVSVMAANNETGVVQPWQELGGICREQGVLFHVDASQALGKLPLESIHDFGADLVTACGHKYHGPKGIGALFMKSPLQLPPLLLGGSHENERRAGTENVAAIVGFSSATGLFVREPVFPASILDKLVDRMKDRLRLVPGLSFHRGEPWQLSNTLAVTVEGCDSLALLANLDLGGVYASSGSACASGSLEPSHVLAAMGIPDALCRSLVRFSLGRETTMADVDYAAGCFVETVERIRSANKPANSR